MIGTTEDGPAPTAPVPDLSDPTLYRDDRATAILDGLRAAAPVHRVDRDGKPSFWAVLSYDLVSRALADAQTFSSTGGMRLDADPVATAAATGKMMVITDPPRHGKIRRIVSNGFTPKMVQRLETNMRSTAIDIIETALDQGECDFAEVAARLPVSVICDMLGVPREGWDFMLKQTKAAFGVGASTADAELAAAAHTEIFLYYDELMRQRREQRQEDIISALVHGSIDDRPLTNEEIILNCNGLVSGGNETTRHATIKGLLAFIRNPEQWHRVRADRSLLPGAIREILRYSTPAMHVLRTAARDTELGGRQIRAGDMVTLWLSSANRDERLFPDPDLFDIERSPNRHLTFAHGAHYCIGSALATTELTIFFDEMLRRVELPELTGEVRRMRSNLIGGVEHMPIRLRRAAA
ncbi:cytochrome P450 [Micromonospora orduensis]|uniref:Cytochrome P450 n=1 Tax=Micromonospora orduensis TaxID=1420891 RepID=A0A5C4QEZ5_9ACTN|nr:cytochrome P450 [Micromonospora orduensis]TNH22709.1 cytochrome P450 [Micromonospora orduensis]